MLPYLYLKLISTGAIYFSVQKFFTLLLSIEVTKAMLVLESSTTQDHGGEARCQVHIFTDQATILCFFTMPLHDNAHLTTNTRDVIITPSTKHQAKFLLSKLPSTLEISPIPCSCIKVIRNNVARFRWTRFLQNGVIDGLQKTSEMFLAQYTVLCFWALLLWDTLQEKDNLPVGVFLVGIAPLYLLLVCWKSLLNAFKSFNKLMHTLRYRILGEFILGLPSIWAHTKDVTH